MSAHLLPHCRILPHLPSRQQGPLQHLYGRLAAELRPGVNDAQILRALHPTPAVCGRPREAAAAWVSRAEDFDRGFYSGPFGWLSGAGAEWAVAIRSALVSAEPAEGGAAAPAVAAGAPAPAAPPALEPAAPSSPSSQAHHHHHRVSVYAGVGVVAGSDSAAEWGELDLKTRPMRALLAPLPALPANAPNVAAAQCALLVEELCRCVLDPAWHGNCPCFC